MISKAKTLNFQISSLIPFIQIHSINRSYSYVSHASQLVHLGSFITAGVGGQEQSQGGHSLHLQEVFTLGRGMYGQEQSHPPVFGGFIEAAKTTQMLTKTAKIAKNFISIALVFCTRR